MTTFKNYTMLYSVAVLLGIIGCSSTPKIVEYPNTADPTEEIAKTNEKINIAKNHQWDVLSPSHFESASEYLDKAKNYQNKNKNQKDVLHAVAVSNSYLAKANENAGVSLEILSKVATERQNALNAEAPKHFEKEFNSIDYDLKKVTRSIEDKNFSQAEKNRASLEARYNKLELQSIKKEQIGMAKDRLEEAINQGAKTLTPVTLDWAQKKIASSEALIENDRHNKYNVEEASREANLASDRLLRIVHQAKNSKELNPEQHAVRLEDSQNKITRSGQLLDASNAELEEQKVKTRELSTENTKLESDVRLENQFKAASQLFSKNEASVFKQEDRMWIRLSGLTFASSKANISADKFPLLAKVERVIQNNLPCTVTIDGHTDTSGDKKKNIKLSMERAQAVAEFFIANNIIQRDRVNVRGLGSAYPIASNKTLKGRILNRRVEVIITPLKSLTLY
jgi:outer membrane protein OmpA-like peptidoglycan-associated protein